MTEKAVCSRCKTIFQYEYKSKLPGLCPDCRSKGKYNLTCNYCGIEFKSYKRNRLYCSPQCNYNARRNKRSIFLKRMMERANDKK